jgi:membrane protein implicated in regulation of membrane protease activity
MEWLSEHAWGAWLGLMLLLAIGEMVSLDLVLGMLAVGAGVGLLAAVVGLPGVAQVLLACAASVACLALIRPGLLKQLHSGPELRLGHGRLVGQQGIVTEAITTALPGRVKVAGEVWSAEAYDETLEIPAGARVDILQIKGATAYVHPVPQLDPPAGPAGDQPAAPEA